ncbi:ArsA family ATPase [Candidatus Binatia bacterium]|nr:ArsA family ATPase [Candidatus Binatia bacterium]
MRGARLIVVTGKGGVGKTTIAAALATHAAAKGARTLVVETAHDGSLAHLFGHRRLETVPFAVAGGIDAVEVNQRRLVEDYFTGLLRFGFLSKRLFASHTFNALTTAAPALTEYLLLEQVLSWLEPEGRRAPRYDLVLLDGPATGHALTLLRAPDSLAAMVGGGPIGHTARRLRNLLADRMRTQVVLVSIPEEMSVRETIETHAALTTDLGLRVARPVVNRVFPRRFSAAEATRIARAGIARPVTEAAQFAIERRREADRHIGVLRRALGAMPIVVRELFSLNVITDDLTPIGRTLGRVVLV